MSTTRPERLILGILCALLFSYALTYVTWQGPAVLITLTLTLVAVEFFPLNVGKTRLPMSFPLVYMMTLISGVEAAMLLGFLGIPLAHLANRQPLHMMFLSTLTRAMALLGGSLAVHLLGGLGLDESSMPYRLLHLIVFLLVYVSIASGMFLYKSSISSPNYHQIRNSIIQAAGWNLLIGFVYCAVMYWIAAQDNNNSLTLPPNVSSQVIATVFFFLPLVALAVVLHLITSLSQTKSKLETLFTVSQSFSQKHEMQDILEQVIREATRLVQGSYGVLYLVQEGGSLEQFGTRGRSIRFPKGMGLVGSVAKTGETLLVSDVMNDPRLHPGETHAIVRNLLLVPIHIDGRIAGVMSLGKKELDPFLPEDVKLMTVFATQAAAAMKKALVIEEREKRLLLEERNRLAREIHDGLAQDLAGIIFQIDLLKRSTDEGVEEKLEELQEVLRKSVATVRHSIYSLRPTPYAKLGLVPSMRQQLREVEEQQGLCTHLQVALPPEPLPTPINKAIFQIFTEAVQNVVKHAEARDLYVSLSGDDEAVTLSIRDNGKGFHFGKAIVQAAARRSFGIENLHNTADEIGGTLDYVTEPGKGTEVILRIPLKEENENDDSRVAL